MSAKDTKTATLKKFYRVVERPSTDINWPIKYVAQRKTWIGWRDVNWSYSLESAREYLEHYHHLKCKILPPQFKERVIEEMEL